MRGVRLTIISLAIVITPAAAFAQTGITPLLTGPETLARKGQEFRGYITIEDDIDLFGVYRRGVGQGFDFGLRLGYSDFANGGAHLGGDIRFGLPASEESDVRFALAGGLQFTFGDFANMIAVPFGVSIGTDVGNEERAVILYALPHLVVERFDHDDRDADTELEFGVELAGEVELTSRLIAHAALTIATNDDDHVEFAVGLIYR